MKKNNKLDNNNGLTSTYIATENQTIYDIAIDIHGTIDGISDILVNNPSLSVDSDVFGGMKITYTSGQTIEQNVVEQLDAMNIIPTNPIRYIYPKAKPHGNIVDIYINKDSSVFSCIQENTGYIIYADWGDNSDIEKILPSTNLIYHQFDLTDDVSLGHRKIRFYIQNNKNKDSVISFSFNDGENKSVVLYNSLTSNYYIDNSKLDNIDFLRLMTNIKKITLNNVSVSSIYRLSYIESFTELNLLSKDIRPSDIDKLFMSIIENYGQRLPATISISVSPTGEYKEPTKSKAGEYIIKNGMEAVWVLVNEESWNSDYYKWKIIIDDIIYTKEK